jgi:hypothetical protein
VQQDIVEKSLDSFAWAGVRLHTFEESLSRLLRRVHPKILFKKRVSAVVFQSVKILLNGYSCLLFRLRSIGGNEHSF